MRKCREFSTRIMKAKNRQERYKKGYVLLEGKRLIADAIQAGADLLTIFVTDRQILDVSISRKCLIPGIRVISFRPLIFLRLI